MKYKLLEILFGWVLMRWVDLTLLDILAFFSEFIVICWITDKILKKLTNKYKINK